MSSQPFQPMPDGFALHQAVAEADRCLLCYDPPCSRDCPADTDPGSFIRKLRLKNVTGAIRTIKSNNIMGGACGILCPTDRLCEKACSATELDRPIQIGNIQRFLVEHGWEMAFNPFDIPTPDRGNVAIIGAGPAGLSCAAHLAQKGFKTTVFEKRAEPGGVLRYGIPSFRFANEFLAREIEDVKQLGVEIQCSSGIDGPEQAEALLTQGYDAVFISTGLWGPIHLMDHPTDASGLYTAVDYLESLRDDQRLKETQAVVKDKTVVVIGGGSVAMDCVEAAVQLQAEDVYLVYRRSYQQMPAEIDERLAALDAGVHFLVLNQPTDYQVEDSQVTGIQLIRTTLGPADKSGRRRPLPLEDSEWTLKTDVIIEAIGNQPEKSLPATYPNVETDAKHLIRIDAETGKTSVAGIFAGGDIVRGPALVVDAVQDGKHAACGIEEYLSQKEDS